MTEQKDIPGKSWRPSIGGGLLAALIFLAIWVALHPAEPLLPSADLYTHLTVARHLVQGEGFQTDITYPLTFAFPFAQQLPQPLIHRGPVFSVMMTLPYLISGQDPVATIGAVRVFQISILGLMAATGAIALLRRGQISSVGAWLVFLGLNPLLKYAVNWGFEELVASWVLLLLWLRNRSGRPPRLVDGLLLGVLCLMRLDLFWVPILWWLWFGREAMGWKKLVRPLTVAVVVALVVQTPWMIRNQKLTGHPFFSLQGQAELVKDTTTWPQYSIYQQLSPQPIHQALAQDPTPIVRKVARGLKFYATNLPKLLPWPWLVLSGLLILLLVRGKITKRPCLFRPDAEEPMSILPTENTLGPLAATALTTTLLAGQYAFFDHSLRHLLVVVPVLVFEFAPTTGDLAHQFISRHIPAWQNRVPWVGHTLATILITGILIWATWTPAEGWKNARGQARQMAPHLNEKIERFQNADPEQIFVSNAALPWFANRPGVWDPQNEDTRRVIRTILQQNLNQP